MYLVLHAIERLFNKLIFDEKETTVHDPDEYWNHSDNKSKNLSEEEDK